ncbi:peptidase M41 [Polaribacter sp. SA4-10]|uniref:ATP-dependent zinc metalloprotease FtsH n=1 Tax=Polaribacter sp. SA4-10 TaxID=754397 RepID=UPI000B3D0657|nr:ATP-dependent zinc metalloprotease FtsH [Polaribacter sp. SA4-10]ARV07768.1 peptidase M41 [Polaribacter sp. SA4-10]
MSDSKKDSNSNMPKFKFSAYWIYGAIFLVLIAVQFFNSGDLATKSISKNEFNEILKENDISKIVVVNNNIAQIFIKDESLNKDKYKKVKTSAFYRKGSSLYEYNFGDLQNFENNIERVRQEKALDFDLKNDERTSMFETILGFLPFIILIAVWLFFMKRMSGGGSGAGGGGQIFNIGKSKAKLFDKDTKVKTTFENVAGLEGAKEEVQEIVDFLKNPEKYTSLGGKIPKGALLVGPPGTGKTLLAKAVAGEADVPFFSLSGSDFVEMFVGVGASRVRDLFKQAAQKSPSIIFIDEIDAIGRARGKNSMTGGNDERENTLNQLLTEMDGFGTDVNVIVLAATNRADVLDSALMRAGRFDRQIYVDLPNINERKEIFEVHIKPLKLADDVNIGFLAQQTPGFSGADIANMCNEAALIAARHNKKAIYHQDFLDAVDRIVGGLEKKNKVITPKEKKTIAFHEAGHATVSWMLEHAAPLVKVTIVPRGQSLGAAWYLPAERMIVQTEQMLDEMCATLGGRAAEKIIFNKISTGALSDLEKVTKQARAMVTVYGLNEKVGNITYYDSSGNDGFVKPYSEDTAKTIDEEISKMIEAQYIRAIELLSENKDKLTILAELLLEKEVIFKDDLLKIFGERPFEDEVVAIKVENKIEEEVNIPPVENKTEEEQVNIPPVENKTEE